MAARLGRNVFAHAQRPKLHCGNFVRRVNGRASFMPQRNMASGSHEAKASSDMPWIIASGTVTIGGIAYLLTPPGKKASHHVAASAHPIEEAHKGATKEGAELRGKGETPTSLQTASKSSEPVKDDEGTEASGEEVKDSIAQGIQTDSPQDAQAHEEKEATGSDDSSQFSSGAPGQTAEVEQSDKPEQKEKPSADKKGSVQDDGDHGPTNMGDARKKAAQGSKSPKEASGESKKE